MSRLDFYRKMAFIARRDFSDIIERTGSDNESCRVYFFDTSFLEVWLGSNADPMIRYAFHWERRHVDGTLFRHDNAPHMRWGFVSSFPKHFHDGSEESVVESMLPESPLDAFVYFMTFIRNFLKK